MIAGKKEMWEFDGKDWFWWTIKAILVLTPFILLGLWLKPTRVMFLYLLAGIVIGFITAIKITD